MQVAEIVLNSQGKFDVVIGKDTISKNNATKVKAAEKLYKYMKGQA